jgi:hypothetical protein
LKRQSLWLQESSAKAARQKNIREFSAFISSLQYKEDVESGTPITDHQRPAEFHLVNDDSKDFFALDDSNNFQQPQDILHDQFKFEDLDDDVVFQPAFSFVNQTGKLDADFASFTNRNVFQSNIDEVGDSTIAIDILASLGIIKDQESGNKLNEDFQLWKTSDIDNVRDFLEI